LARQDVGETPDDVRKNFESAVSSAWQEQVEY
jgi:hypothetical protein